MGIDPHAGAILCRRCMAPVWTCTPMLFLHQRLHGFVSGLYINDFHLEVSLLVLLECSYDLSNHLNRYVAKMHVNFPTVNTICISY